MTGLVLRWGTATDTGLVRPHNEDTALAEPDLFAVADGMGGHAAGEVASRLAVEALRRHAGDGLVDAVRLANRAVLDRAGGDTSLQGMGTTLCAIAPSLDGGGGVEVVNVGDSRVYLLRDGELSQVTEDHSLVADLEREGRITAAEARVHPHRNIITRVLGNEDDVEVDLFRVDAYRGDRFLLCSDGLFDEVDDETIAGVLRRQAEPQAAADELVRLAREAGGRDNITVVVVDVVDDDDRGARASAALPGTATAGRRQAGEAAEAGEREREGDGAGDGPGGAVVAAGGGERSPRRRTLPRVGWRPVVFVAALVAVVAVAVGATVWVARSTYFVGFDGDEVTIFRGRPGGVLWLDPTVEQRTGLQREDVPPSRLAAVEEGKEVATLADARRYVANLRTQAAAGRDDTAVTTTSTTMVPGAPTTAEEPPPP